MRRPTPLHRVWLLPCLLATAAQGAAPADEGSSIARLRDELFQQVFGHPPPPFPVESHVLVVIDGAVRVKMRAELPPDGSAVLLEGRPLTHSLTGLLRPDLVRQLEQRIDSRGFLDRAALEQAGIVTRFEPRGFEYTLTTTSEMRAGSIVYVTPPLPDPFAVDALRPGTLSGFLNFNLKGLDRREIRGDLRTESRDLGIALDGALNLRGLVLEGSASATARENSWSRGDLRLVYDQPQQALRFIAGDLIYPAIGYQTALPAGGVGFSKDFTLQPQVLTYWTGECAFRLDHAAEVKIFRNDSLITTLQLPAGVHDLRRFTPAVGQNDIDVAIEDSAGRREVVHFSFIHDPALLDLGLSRYSWNAGFARQLRDGGYHYDTDRPVFSGSYLRGVTAATTLGSYAQFADGQALLGVQALHALPPVTLLVDTALSRTRAGQLDGAARITLTSSSARNRPEAHLSLGYQGRYFHSGPAGRARDALAVQGGLAMPLWSGLAARLGAGYFSAPGPAARHSYFTDASLLQGWGRNVTATLSLRRGRTPAGSDSSVLFGLRASFTHATGSYVMAKELEGDRVSARWNSSRYSSLSTPYGFAQVRADPDLRELQAGGGYLGNQGLTEAAYLRSERTGPGLPSRREEVSVRLEGALAFVDGALALSRTVRENFAIVAGKEGLDHTAMQVDPDRRGGSRARSTWLGPAVLPELSSYRLRTLNVEPVDAPLGAVPDSLSFRLAPTFKSGTLLRLGRELLIIAVGRLIDAAGMPVSHLPITILCIDRPGEAAVRTFTGSNGNFQAPDLRPGRYEIRSSDPRWGHATVDIAQAPDGMHRLGEILLPPGS